MSKVLMFAVALAALVVGAAVLTAGVDRALVVTWYDQPMYYLVLALVYVIGDALRRAIKR